ncbi:hypothetical protein SNE35_10050 [Paucibacter sp. R3-3]|uniref:Uncharacterized protein n=1 Tax=Roseateles agri TaxID=3098619 RepID=A0ABU5DF05_9BURK|nr:hypothetical protein [Paucibacter sp. R3-3]MDY0744850.1 hypothetical protein [Paucibacter sp. R3-3]
MRHIALVLLAGLACSASQAQMAPPGVKDMIVTGGLNAGKTHRVAEHCGASADTLKAYKARFDADTKGGAELYASLDVDIEKVFLQGRKDGDAFYDTVKSSPNRDTICSQTLALVKSQAGK